jgi:hypothetical protein
MSLEQPNNSTDQKQELSPLDAKIIELSDIQEKIKSVENDAKLSPDQRRGQLRALGNLEKELQDDILDLHAKRSAELAAKYDIKKPTEGNGFDDNAELNRLDKAGQRGINRVA